MKAFNGYNIVHAMNNGSKDKDLQNYVDWLNFKNLKRRIDFEELNTLADINNHWYLKEVLPQFIDRAKKHGINDLYLTGSWVRGTYRHPLKKESKDKIELAKKVGSSEISDLDFWTSETSREKFNEVFKEFSNKIGIHVSWVSWPGPGILLTTDTNSEMVKSVGCNENREISNNYKNRY